MKKSAGLLMYRIAESGIEVLLGHPGGPFFRGKDEGSWTVPKGLIESDEDPLAAARREFCEETGLEPSDLPAADGELLDLGEVRLVGGKLVRCWGFRGQCDPSVLESNTFELEWPPRSGRRQQFPEIDRFELFDLVTAAAKLNEAQRPFLERLVQRLGQCSASFGEEGG